MRVYLQSPFSRNPWHWLQVLATCIAVHWVVRRVPYEVPDVTLHFTKTLYGLALGTYNSDNRTIAIARAPELSIGHVLLHELGHHVYCYELTEGQRTKWDRWVLSNCRGAPLQEVKQAIKQSSASNSLELDKYLISHNPLLCLEIRHILRKHLLINPDQPFRSRNYTLKELYSLLRNTKGSHLFKHPFTQQCVPTGNSYYLPYEIFAEAFAAHYGKRKMPPQVKKQLLPLLSTSSEV